MNDPKLFERPELTEAEEDNALMPFISEDDTSGRWRWKNIRGFFASLHRRNPLVIQQERTTIFESTAGVNDRDFSETYNLDIRQGANRHDFTDGYSFFEFYTQRGQNTSNLVDNRTVPTLILATLVLNATESDSLEIFNGYNLTYTHDILDRFAKNSDTSFKLAGIDTNGTARVSGILSKIVGIKFVATPESLV